MQFTLMEPVSDCMVRIYKHQWPAGGHIVGRLQCSSCSLFHKGADTESVARLFPYSGPVQVSCNSQLPGISSMVWRIKAETANRLVSAHMDVPS